ncbi:DNA repair protein RadA [Oceanibacterium hippocampi]|uniref:DNA repair protein RadA n=1 Tax=Oceanibacterium hippocampi TaxID=745714 RepID=A0A1Y5STS1_9PROT|nr:DNA repair protein RadA [Oceanibacterium hippocampi]SLN47906.1 hypothetical protein OCH7691_02072 [Oceanibacterium hippocampi]
MAKRSDGYQCQACGARYPKWQGKCDACDAWNSLTEETAPEAVPKGLNQGKGRTIAFTTLDASVEEAPRIPSGVGEFDRVLGGGLVAGSAVLLGGDPGIGKSTILLQALARLAAAGQSCAYISGEEATAQIVGRARRLGLENAPLKLATATSLRDILATLEEGEPPRAVVIDSIQTIYADNLDSAPGTVSQVRTCSHELVRFAKRRGVTLFLVGHVTKDGQIAGPRVVEHMVDTVLYFEGERGHQFRILRAVKNRFGAADEIGVFEMTDRGLAEVSNPSALFLGNRENPVSGAAVFSGIEGSRPLLVEIQALVASSPLATPRRAVVGWDSARLAMLLAVLDTRCGLALGGMDVYLNVAGGLRVQEPGADLAVVAALLSSMSDQPTPARTFFFGEVGLSGEIRPVGQAESRCREAAKLGFDEAVVPAGLKLKPVGLKLRELRRLDELVQLFRVDESDARAAFGRR